jgi:hypothetical protein
MNLHPEIAARVFNAPRLMYPGKLAAAIAGIGSRIVGREMGSESILGRINRILHILSATSPNVQAQLSARLDSIQETPP